MDMFESLNTESMNQMRGIFASIFILQNRLQTACEKIQTDISMKQWLLLAMTDFCTDERTLTNIAKIMGCSRQNVKQLAVSLERKGYIEFLKGANNAVHIQLTEKSQQYAKEMEKHHAAVFQILFSDFSEKEIQQLFGLYSKLYAGISKVEMYARGDGE